MDFKSEYIKYKNKYLNSKKKQRKEDTIQIHNKKSEMKNYDYIIIGAGSAGAVMAARLSENKNLNILLIEAGKNFMPDKYPKDLADCGIVGTYKYDWGYKSTPGYIKQSIDIPRAKVIGGCSAHNACVALRAQPFDFDRWRKKGIKNWNYDDVLKTYKFMETSNIHNKWHGNSGPFPSIQPNLGDLNDLDVLFIKSAMNNGYDYISDFNNDKYRGVGPTVLNVINGKRQNTGMVYLTNDVRLRHNLTIKSETLVDRIIIKKRRAKIVVLSDGNQISSTKEIILSAGAIGSPAILMRSGIGPINKLNELNIPLVKDYPVGKTLQEQPLYFKSFPLKTSYHNKNLNQTAKTLLRTNSLDDTFDLNIICDFTYTSKNKIYLNMGVALMAPDSIGEINLKSKNPHDKPIIDLNLLAMKRDRDRMLKGIKIAYQIANTKPLKNIIDFDNIEFDINDEDRLLKDIKDNVDGFGHLSCSVPMGVIVDEFGLVKNINGLRVVDASIFPEMIASTPNATIIMMAEYISKLILNNYKKKGFA